MKILWVVVIGVCAIILGYIIGVHVEKAKAESEAAEHHADDTAGELHKHGHKHEHDKVA